MGLAYYSEKDTANTRRGSAGRGSVEGLDNKRSYLPGIPDGKRASSAATQPLQSGSPSSRFRTRGSTAQESGGSNRSRASLTVRTEASRSSLKTSSPLGSPQHPGSPQQQQLQDAKRRSTVAVSPKSHPRGSLLASPAARDGPRKSVTPNGAARLEAGRRRSLADDPVPMRSARLGRPHEDTLFDVQPRHTFHTFGSLALLLAAQYGIGQPKFTRTDSRFSLPQRRWGQIKEAVTSLQLYSAKLEMQELTFFQKLTPIVQQQMLKAVQFARLDRGSPLYLQGNVAGVDDPGNLYILISGEVVVQMVEEDPTTPVAETAASPERSERARNLGNVVATIQPGALLGHHSLLEKRPRKNSCLCAVDCEFLILRKKDFDKILRSSLEALADGSAIFLLQHVPGLRKLPRLKADQVMHSFQRTVFDRNHVFARQGEAGITQSVYIIIRGCVEVRKGKHKVGMLIAGAIFATAVVGELEDFTIAVDSRQACEAFEVHASALSSLPQQMRTEIQKCITQLREWHFHREEELEISTKARACSKLDGSVMKAVSLPAMPREQSPPSSQQRVPQQTRPAWATDTSYCEFPNSKSASRLGTSLKAARGRIFASVEYASSDQLDTRGSFAWGSPRETGLQGLPQVTQTPHKASRTTISEARQVLRKMRCSM